ncbi:Hypothetical protein LUCI_4318 [Lucifera butyrica]|uniref:DUF4280 domain-containing protein n=1 Tax=Lucifera butyrica TaxID=1351585 RepID=A0A498RG30_9FIRM|nr:DUF4280 domain-containing protein [Lucifera butyrica]VBB09032.1 Hypothetical protein LUCI_4318 [Lucifera butyrica]
MDIRYVVRGGTVQCNRGSTPTRLNLPKSHGVYVNGKAVFNDKDQAADVNVMPFGTCGVTDGPCHPILFPVWKATKEDTLIKGRPAVISQSYLSCAVGGTITITKDGQLD